MEILIITCILGIVFYLIYQTLPSTKFDRAKVLFNKGNFLDALSTLESIIDDHPDAPAKIAEIKIRQGLEQINNNEETALSFFNQVLDQKKKLSKKSNRTLYEKYEAKANYEISKLEFYKIVPLKPTESKLIKITNNIKFIDEAIKQDLEDDFLQLKLKHLALLSDVHYEFGIQDEKAGNLTDAISNYSKSINFAQKSSTSKLIKESVCRTEICKLKRGEKPDINKLPEIAKSPKKFQNDFYYRYSIKLIYDGRFDQADFLITNYLDLRNTHVSRLKKIITIEKQNKAIQLISGINQKLEKLYKDSFPINDVNELYENLNSWNAFIKKVFPEISNKVEDLKPSLFNRLLSNCISENKFSDAFDLIQKFPNFWNNHELLKNLGICSHGLIRSGNLSEENYKQLISAWLTAIYSDRVILNSLKNTSWDDDFTFTLIQSIGSEIIIDDLPGNVNYDEVSEKNISIGATQRELIDQFESLLCAKISDATLMKKVLGYYNYEKTAIERIISILQEDILFAGPYFAKAHGINEQIISYLDQEYSEFSNEEALDAGIPYLKSFSGTYVREYSEAKELLDDLSEAIRDGDILKIKEIRNDNKKELLGKYETIKDKVENILFNDIASRIDDDPENPDLINIIDEVVNISLNNEKLRYQYSTYVSGYCIGKVNNKELNYFEALKLMKKAYLYSPSNPSICRNLITLIKFNLTDILNETTSNQFEIYRILDEIYSKRSDVFKQNTAELSNERTEILNVLKKKGVDIRLFESFLPIDSGQTLTPQGEKMKKVLSYFKKMSDGRYAQTSNDQLQKLLHQLNLDNLPI